MIDVTDLLDDLHHRFFWLSSAKGPNQVKILNLIVSTANLSESNATRSAFVVSKFPFARKSVSIVPLASRASFVSLFWSRTQQEEVGYPHVSGINTGFVFCVNGTTSRLLHSSPNYSTANLLNFLTSSKIYYFWFSVFVGEILGFHHGSTMHFREKIHIFSERFTFRIEIEEIPSYGNSVLSAGTSSLSTFQNTQTFW